MDMDITNAAPTRLTVICAWHTPQAELDAINRDQPDTVTHGICAACVVKFEAGGR